MANTTTIAVSGSTVAVGDSSDNARDNLPASNVTPFPSTIQTPPTMVDNRDK